MFPASAGMNRLYGRLATFAYHVPRERGDEPDVSALPFDPNQCSPRARG